MHADFFLFFALRCRNSQHPFIPTDVSSFNWQLNEKKAHIIGSGDVVSLASFEGHALGEYPFAFCSLYRA